MTNSHVTFQISSYHTWLPLAIILFLHALEADNMRRVILSTLVHVSLVLRYANLRVDILTLELVEIGEGLWNVTVKILHDIQRLLEFLGSHFLLDHVDFDFAQRLSRVRLYSRAHVHNLFTFALLGALVLHLVEDFFEVGVLHQPFVGAFGEFAAAVLQADEVVDELVLGEWVLEHSFLNLVRAHLLHVRFVGGSITLAWVTSLHTAHSLATTAGHVVF